VAVDTRSAWVQKAESAVTALRGVEAVRILADGDTIREIHVLSTSNRPAKQIVRDVQSVLLTRFGREIDYRVVSVAYCEPTPAPRMVPSPPVAGVETAERTPPAATAPAPPPAVAAVTAAAPPSTSPGPVTPPAPARVHPAERASERSRAAPPETEPVAAGAERIRFVSVNLFVAGPRTQAQVELRWKGLPRMGSASGWSTRDGAHRLVAGAAVAAVHEFLAEPVALSVEEVRLVGLGRRRAVVVSVAMVGHRHEKLLTGCCAVEQDLQQAVVLATLSALNRLVGGLPVREPTEYVLRPTST
jgi:hypothetical protein